MLAAAALASAAGWFTGTWLPLLVADVVADRATSHGRCSPWEVLFAVGTLLPLSLVLGTLPARARLAAPHAEAVARGAAAIYGANTIGAMLGSLGGAFLLVPTLGLERPCGWRRLLMIGGACLAVVAGRPRRRRRLAGLAAAATVAGGRPGHAAAWDRDAAGERRLQVRRRASTTDDLATALQAGALLYYKEGAAATVSVRQSPGRGRWPIDGKVDASNGGDMLTQKLLAHLPLLLHPRPARRGDHRTRQRRDAGRGARHPIERADVVEISPEVVEASAFFDAVNHRALGDPRTRLIVGDGRSHLLLARATYDVIISEPSNPWMAGVAALFTREFFAAARDRLAPGGLVCQWAHTYDISDADLRSIVGDLCVRVSRRHAVAGRRGRPAAHWRRCASRRSPR